MAGAMAIIEKAARLFPTNLAIGNAVTVKIIAKAKPIIIKVCLAVFISVPGDSFIFVLSSDTNIVIAFGTPAVHIKKKNVYTVYAVLK